ncbi:MAG: aminodeoxychorismate/anthranilate synthase component II [Pseudomonadota bacterium]|nr:aminodeoxychorismate/anthranilate synthase component II [Pseudomonadota bacterium]
MILLIDNYDSFTWNLVHYIGELGAEVVVRRNDHLSADEALASGCEGIVLSPGPGRPEDSGICLDVVRKAPASLPIFGVCLGHQTIGEAYGGTVLRAAQLMHGKTSVIRHNGDPMFEGVPEHFTATRYHSLIVDTAGFPDALMPTAWTDDGTIMALRHRTRPVFGVQFHPESIASEYGHRMLQTFLGVAGLKQAA